MTKEISVCILWSDGKMGQYLAAELADIPYIKLLDIPKFKVNTSNINDFRRHLSFDFKKTIIVDFSNPEVTNALFQLSLEEPINLISGTSDIDKDLLSKAANHSQGYFYYSENFCRSFELIKKFIDDIKNSDENWDFSVLDIHGNHKKDAPSGTASALHDYWYAKESAPSNKIASLRVGSGVSEHIVTLDSGTETLKVGFTINNRDAFLSNILTKINDFREKVETIDD